MKWDTSRPRRARALPACALAIGAATCAGPRPLEIPGPGVNPRHAGRPPENQNVTQVDHGFAAKIVAGKEEPTTLIAKDGSRCTVPEPRFREIQIGENALCPWRTGDRAP